MKAYPPLDLSLACLIAALTCVSTRADDKADALLKDAELRKTLDLVNVARKASGLEPVKLSAPLTAGCTNHAKYMVINKGSPKIEGLKAHEEDKSLKGYSADGEEAAKSSVIHFVKPTQAVEGWMSTFYHRLPLLQPNLKEVGIGYYTEKDYTVAVVDCISGVDLDKPPMKDVVFYPEDGQKDVTLEFYPEIPDPFPTKHKGKAGCAVTVMFAAEQKVKDANMTLTDAKGKPIESYVTTPEAPATKYPQWNAVLLIPAKPLVKDQEYSAKITADVNGKKYERAWMFRTSKGK